MARHRTKRKMDAVLAQPIESDPFDDEPAPDRSSWDKRKRKQAIYLTKKREKDLQELKKQDEPDKSSKMSEPARTPPISGLHWQSAHSDAVWLDNHHSARFKVGLDRCDVCQQHREESDSATIRHAAKEDERRAGRLPKREQRPEIRIFRHQHAIFFRGELEDRGIVRGLQAELADMYRVVASRAEALREPWRQRVVDEELQTEAASGSCRSSTAAAA